MKVTIDAPDEVDDELVNSINQALDEDATVNVHSVEPDSRPGAIEVFEGTVHTHRLPFEVVGATVTSDDYTRIHLKNE
jgi:hypothetical protein